MGTFADKATKAMRVNQRACIIIIIIIIILIIIIIIIKTV